MRLNVNLPIRRILDIGCGTHRSPGAVGIDILDLKKYHPKGKFYQCDIDNENLPFKDNTFDDIIASHVLEHCRNLVHVMEEIWRVSKPGAIVKIEVPEERSKWAWGEPTHVRCFNENTLKFFVKGYYVNNSRYGFKCDFDIIDMSVSDIFLLNCKMKVIKPIR